jgi:hypothetical protein
LDAAKMTFNDAPANRFELKGMRLTFAKTAMMAFAFLVDLGFSVVDSSPTIVKYKKGDMEVDVYHGRSSFELGFGISKNGVRYALSELMRLIDANVANQYRNYVATTQNGVNEGLIELATTVKQFCISVLQGTPECFTALESQRQSWNEEYALEVLERQLLPRADEAFRLGHYQEAAELYERIKSRLSPSELKKLHIAAARSRAV